MAEHLCRESCPNRDSGVDVTYEFSNQVIPETLTGSIFYKNKEIQRFCYKKGKIVLYDQNWVETPISGMQVIEGKLGIDSKLILVWNEVCEINQSHLWVNYKYYSKSNYDMLSFYGEGIGLRPSLKSLK